MHLVLFDIDDTLTQSQAIDAEIYLHSLSELFGFEDVDSDWSKYRHATDSAIFQEIFEKRLGRIPLASEVAAFREHFVKGIAAAAIRTPFREIAGAARAITHLAASPVHCLGLATGGWSDSARCKMRSAGMQYDAFPSASADDGLSRVSIMQSAIQRAIARTGGSSPDSIVYIGDGIWDARACQQLNVPLIGIATGIHAERLRAEGATAVFPDYSDLNAFCEALKSARRPM